MFDIKSNSKSVSNGWVGGAASAPNMHSALVFRWRKHRDTYESDVHQAWWCHTRRQKSPAGRLGANALTGCVRWFIELCTGLGFQRGLQSRVWGRVWAPVLTHPMHRTITTSFQTSRWSTHCMCPMWTAGLHRIGPVPSWLLGEEASASFLPWGYKYPSISCIKALLALWSFTYTLVCPRERLGLLEW